MKTIRSENEYDVFISYSRKDIRWVNKLVRDLKTHHVKPWVDTLEITVGNNVRARIEEGIEKSKYFCFIISPQSLESYYVKRIELEAAFSRLVDEKKDSFILPILLRRSRKKIPLMIRPFHYLNFSDGKKYAENLTKLARKIRLDDLKYTGSLWYKGIDVSPLGIFIGISKMTHKSYSGNCTEIHYESGYAKTLDMYSDGKIDCKKKIFYRNGKVSVIEQYRSSKRSERLEYFYSRSGRRRRKQWFGTSDYPCMEAEYNISGQRTLEKWLNPDGSLDDSKGFAFRVFIFNKSGDVVEVQYLNKNKEIVKKE